MCVYGRRERGEEHLIYIRIGAKRGTKLAEVVFSVEGEDAVCEEGDSRCLRSIVFQSVI